MNFAELPYELQFKYLIRLPYSDIINYCESSKLANNICQSEHFWNTKSLRDFDISIRDLETLKEFSTLNPEKKYRKLRYLYTKKPQLLILWSIRTGNINLIPSLLENIPIFNIDRKNQHFIDLDPFIVEMLEESVNIGSYDTLKFIINIFDKIFTKLKYTDLLNDYIRWPFFKAVIKNRHNLADLMRPYYSWHLDRSEELQEWLWQWKNMPEGKEKEKILHSLKRARIGIPYDDDD